MINLNIFNTTFYISLFAFFFLFGFFVCFARLHFNFGHSFIDRILVTDYRILYILFSIFSFLFIYIFSIILCFGFDISVLSVDDVSSWLADKNNTEVKIGENATVNVNAGKLSVSVDTKVAAAISAGAGASAGIQVAKYVAGPPAVKIGAGVVTAIGVQAITTAMSVILGSNNSNNGGASKLVDNLILSSNASSVSSALNDYPLNLLLQVNTLLICALAFLYIILNIYLSKYIINKDFVKYIPASLQNHKIGKFLVFWLNKYLNLWSKSSNYLLGYCYLMLFIFIGFCKFVLYIILSS